MCVCRRCYHRRPQTILAQITVHRWTVAIIRWALSESMWISTHTSPELLSFHAELWRKLICANIGVSYWTTKNNNRIDFQSKADQPPANVFSYACFTCCSCCLGLDLMTLIYETDIDILKFTCIPRVKDFKLEINRTDTHWQTCNRAHCDAAFASGNNGELLHSD